MEESAEEGILAKALQQKLKKGGNAAQAKLLEVSGESPNRAEKLTKLVERGRKEQDQKPFTREEALGLLLELGLTDRQYIVLRFACVQKGYTNILHTIHNVRAEKANCRPAPKGCIKVTESSAEVPLQNLLDHTAGRLVEVNREVFVQESAKRDVTRIEAVLTLSWGMDGSSGQSQYKQGSRGGGMIEDSNLFATAMIPLQIDNSHCIYWRNKRPQSQNFCRPIKLQFAKETRELVLAERERVESEIRILKPFRVEVSEVLEVVISFRLYLTIIDGKILNFFTNTSSMSSCPLCHATPAQFNDLRNLETGVFETISQNMQHGASPLHAYIRFFECVLHISYRLSFQQWRRNKEQVEISKAQQKIVQQQFIDRLSLRVDFPKPGGSGTSNDGNTARRAFQNYDVFSEITGVDKLLLFRFKTILCAINCQLPLNPEAFGKLVRGTAELYVRLYSWYPMPSTVHKILIHGEEIVRSCTLPIGFLSEEAGESCNKLYKSNRLHHTRKTSRDDTILDLTHRSLEISDPKLSSSRLGIAAFQSGRSELPPEVTLLLLEPSVVPARRALNFDPDEDDYEEGLDFILAVEEEIDVETSIFIAVEDDPIVSEPLIEVDETVDSRMDETC
jgi:hypothetical protein